MFPKDLIVFIEEPQGRDARLAHAAALAQTWGAHLIATFVVDRLELDPHAGFATGSGLAEMLKHHDLEVAEASDGCSRAFADQRVRVRRRDALRARARRVAVAAVTLGAGSRTGGQAHFAASSSVWITWPGSSGSGLHANPR